MISEIIRIMATSQKNSELMILLNLAQSCIRKKDLNCLLKLMPKSSIDDFFKGSRASISSAVWARGSFSKRSFKYSRGLRPLPSLLR